MWITTCISSAVLEKPQPQVRLSAAPADSGQQFEPDDDGLHRGRTRRPSFGKDPKEFWRVAIIHEDGAYGVDVLQGQRGGGQGKRAFNIVLKEGYSATAPDLSALVTKLKRARPDVIFHTGYNPDITLFFRQGARAGPQRSGRIVGHGAGLRRLRRSSRTGAWGRTSTTSSIPIRSRSGSPIPRRSIPSCRQSSRWSAEEFRQAEARASRSVRLISAWPASNTYLFMTEVLPRAIKKYGRHRRGRVAQGCARHRHPRGRARCWGFGVKFLRSTAPRWPDRTRARLPGSSSSTSMTSHTWCGRRASSRREPVLPLARGHDPTATNR